MGYKLLSHTDLQAANSELYNHISRVMLIWIEKSWTALLAEINFQDQQRKSFWQYYLRERERRGETERDGELKDILVHATVQGKISAPRGCQ